MAFEMCRVFCATPGDLEDERQAFYQVMGEFNEREAMPRGVLFVSVSIPPHMTNKLAYRNVVDENVRACKFFVQVLHDTWGPPERSFAREYSMAAQCAGRAVLFKAPNGRPIEPEVLALKQQSAGEEFGDLDDFKQRLRAQLSAWLATIPVE
jgi:hypothetical protein